MYKTELQSGSLCLCVNEALTRLWVSQFALLQTFYFSPENQCILNQPPWTNITYPRKITAGDVFLLTRKTRLKAN